MERTAEVTDVPDIAAEPDPVVRSAERLCETLEHIGDALVAIDADALLDTEATLEQLVATLAVGGGPVRDRAVLLALVRRAADALLRCRRLGASFTNVAGARVRQRTGLEQYGRDGGFVAPAVAGSTVKVTT